MSEEAILQVFNVCKAFGGVQALLDVSFSVQKGEVFGIIGPNGSGKTTLINCITGFIKMNSGKVLYKDKEISNRAPNQIANLGVTRTFQIMRPYYSLPAYKNLVIPLLSPRARRTGGWRGGGKLGDRETVSIDILEEIGFERDSFVPYKLASSLPTGYLKRLELARCLALRPDVILCDEVFISRQTVVRPHNLESSCDAKIGNLIGRPVTNLFAFIENLAGVHLDETRDAIDKGCLP